MKEVLLLAIIILFPLSISCSAESDGLSIDLIHRYSPLSPFYNSSMTQSDFLIDAAFISISRAKLFNLTDPDQSKFAETDLIPNNANYLMKIFIGTPPVETFATADTGGDLVWIQCLPCEQCYPQKAPIFNPRKSTTYKEVSCDSNPCKLLRLPACGTTRECRYQVTYEDKSLTVGNLATDTVSFNNSFAGRIVKYPTTILGCGHTNIGRFRPTGEGIIGLGNGPLSLVTQLGDKIGKRKFSYCLLPRYFTTGSSKLKFGVDTQKYRRRVVSTPLVPKFPSTDYHITLTGVSINAKALKSDQIKGNIIVDSGTTLTLLKSDFYNKIEAAVVEAIGDQSFPERGPPEPFKLCYRYGTIKNIPTITFQFSGAIYGFQLSQAGIFGRVRQLQCFLIIPTEGISILGNVVQEFYNVEYDLDARTVSFAKADCTKE